MTSEALERSNCTLMVDVSYAAHAYGCKFSGNLVLGGNFRKFPPNCKYYR